MTNPAPPTTSLEWELKASLVHRGRLIKEMAELKQKHEREINYLKWKSKLNFWKRFLPPKIIITFGDW